MVGNILVEEHITAKSDVVVLVRGKVWVTAVHDRAQQWINPTEPLPGFFDGEGISFAVRRVILALGSVIRKGL